MQVAVAVQFRFRVWGFRCIVCRSTSADFGVRGQIWDLKLSVDRFAFQAYKDQLRRQAASEVESIGPCRVVERLGATAISNATGMLHPSSSTYGSVVEA